MSTSAPYGDPATRRRILEAAWALVAEAGARVTMAQVAERAEVSRQAVYLHFGGREGLLVALVAHMDETLGLGELAAEVRTAATGVEALARMVALHATYHEKIIAVARVLDASRHRDPAVAAAWEDRMAGRRRAHREIVERIAREGRLSSAFDVGSAATLFHAVTLPRVWDELVTERGWTTERYRVHLTQLLTAALVDDGTAGS